MEKVDWKVEGMTCSNCVLSVSKYLQKEGMEEVKVNPISGAVSFSTKETIGLPGLKKGINALGYTVFEKGAAADGKDAHAGFLSTNKKRLLFCLPFTLVLMLHLLDGWIHLHWLMNPWIQLALCLPVFLVGMWYFGRSALKSLRGAAPNMNVLISIGALASFGYSLTGAIVGLGPDYLFFETTASIITLVASFIRASMRGIIA